MYKIIGADGNEYGPVNDEQIRQWIAEGRANEQTRVRVEDASDWQTLADRPEFAGALGAKPLPPSSFSTPGYSSPDSRVLDQVSGPATGLIVTAVLGFLANGFMVIWFLVAGQFQALPPDLDPEIEKIFQVARSMGGVVSALLGVALSALVWHGALQLKKGRSYGWAMTAAILALVPCTSPCCLVGVPIGIWALVVLMRPEVKSALQQLP
mgnify:CR=1 FL=1